YDLRTIPESARCPECGLLVDESMRAIGGWSTPRLRALRWLIAIYPIGVLSWAAFDVLLATTPHTKVTRAIAAALLAVHAAAICAAALLGTYASSRQRRSVRFGLSLAFSLVVVSAAFLIMLVALKLISKTAIETKVANGVGIAARLMISCFASWWLMEAMRSLI